MLPLRGAGMTDILQTPVARGIPPSRDRHFFTPDISLEVPPRSRERCMTIVCIIVKQRMDPGHESSGNEAGTMT